MTERVGGRLYAFDRRVMRWRVAEWQSAAASAAADSLRTPSSILCLCSISLYSSLQRLSSFYLDLAFTLHIRALPSLASEPNHSLTPAPELPGVHTRPPSHA